MNDRSFGADGNKREKKKCKKPLKELKMLIAFGTGFIF